MNWNELKELSSNKKPVQIKNEKVIDQYVTKT